MITAILGALTGIAGLASKSFQRYQERKVAEHDVLLAKEEARKQLAMKAIQAELELGGAQIKSTGKWFKYLTFFMWLGPYILSMAFPQYGVKVFENLNQLPEWYVQSCMVIMFAIWGIQASKDSINNIFAGLSGFFKERQRLAFHKKMFYDVVRSVKGNLSQAEVDIYEKALKSALPEESKK